MAMFFSSHFLSIFLDIKLSSVIILRYFIKTSNTFAEFRNQWKKKEQMFKN